MSASKGDRVCVGQITTAHGIRGLVKVRAFTAEPEGVTAYGPLTDDHGRRLAITFQSMVKGQWLAAVEGVSDRDAAEALRGTNLYVAREMLPPPEDEDEFYYADLIGLQVRLPDGSRLGRVQAVDDFGAGDVIDVALDSSQGGGLVSLPFTRAIVPTVDVAGGFLVLVPPDGALDRAGDESGSGRGAG